MATTPPPRGRVHTPPTPRHGAKHDSWVPYSPLRRSPRVAAHRALDGEHLDADMTPTTKRLVRKLMEEDARSSTHASSTPSISPPTSPSSSMKFLVKKREQRKTHNVTMDSEDDVDLPAARPRASASLLDMAGDTPLLTPAKTPRKRQATASSSLNRVLFQNRPTSVDDAMPSARRARKGKNQDVFAFVGLDDEDGGNPEKIEVYTDSKERVPTPGAEDENVFLSSYKPKKNGKAKSKPRRQSDAEMEKAAAEGKGMIYVHRGKKHFRAFSDHSASDTDNSLPGRSTNRRRGPLPGTNRFPHGPRITRSSIKPVLLFPNEAQRREREAPVATNADEEATTDIELPLPGDTTPTRFNYSRGSKWAYVDDMQTSPDDPVPTPARHQTQSSSVGPTSAPGSATPVKPRAPADPMTPPSTTRATRSSTAKNAFAAVAATMTAEAEGEEMEGMQDTMPLPLKGDKPKKRSPFASWHRTKTGAGGPSDKADKKREGEPMASDGRKRARSDSSV